MKELEKLYTVEEIAQMTMLTTRTIRNYLRDGILKGRKIGGQWRFTSDDVERFMDSGTVGTAIADDAKQSVLDFVDGVNTDITGEVQICAIIDLYVKQEAAKRRSDEFCALIDSGKGETCFKYKYVYSQDEEKARYIIFASPGFISKAMDVLK